METFEITFERLVEKQEEGTYFPVEFHVPVEAEKLEIRYDYARYEETVREGQKFRKEKNIVDLAVCAPQGYIGSSGSDRTRIVLSAYESSQGFAPCEILEGTWKVILGAYKISQEGCLVRYTVMVYPKEPGLYKGDTHMHTVGSDGNCTLDEIAQMAQKQGLDYVIITDHNNYAHNSQIRPLASLTMIPGAEWTHYQGHAGMLGVNRPFDNPFCVNTPEEMEEKFRQASERGALRVLNHPFCPNCGWRWGMDAVEYDLIEVWNGATPPEVNLKCLAWWDGQLKAGKKIPVIGGSDFHRMEFGRMLASPCTWLYAPSRTPGDLLDAMKQGHGFITYSPDGPILRIGGNEGLLGDTVSEDAKISFTFERLRKGDVIALISNQGEERIPMEEFTSEYTCTRTVKGLKYLRAQVYREPDFARGMPALISNPFYVGGQEDGID